MQNEKNNTPENGATTLVVDSNTKGVSVQENLKELAEEIKRQDTKVVADKYFSPARKSGYICECDNGTGEDGTGAEIYFNSHHNRYELKCQKCGRNLNNLEIIAYGENLNLNDKKDFAEAVKIGCELYGLNFTTKCISEPKKHTENLPTIGVNDAELQLIHDDIEFARGFFAQCNQEITEQGRKLTIRGLTYDTLNFFGCGFIGEWISPKNRIEFEQGKRTKLPPSSQRYIVPTANHYNAVLPEVDRTYENKKFWKMHAGAKEIFGAEFLTANADLILVVEGEFDAMSIWQATQGKKEVIATGGAADKRVVKFLHDKFTVHKPKILILFDSDDTGRLNSPKLRDELLNIGFPAVCKFLSDENSKVDVNDILQKQGDEKLNEIISSIVDNAQADFVAIKENFETSRADDGANSKRKSNSRQLSKEEKFALFSLPHTDLYNASRLSMFYGDKIRFLTDSHKWYIYSKNIWTDGGKENSAILPFARDLAFTISANVDDTIESDEKLYKMWQKRKTYANAIEILKGTDEILITEQDLNTHSNLLNCKNCVVDLETGKEYPHNPKLLMTQMINAEYRAGYRNERVDKFLSEILPDEETLQALLRFLGYCLTGEICEEKALFIHGRGGNGKSVTTKTLLNLFADYACGFPIEAILRQPFTKDGDAATPAFNKLQWRRLTVAEEIPAGRKLDYAKFKILTGGDALPIRKLHQEATEIKNPMHKMIFSGNHLPELDDAHDAGILRRWLQIRFEQDFTNNPDTTLKKFLQTDDALSAMLNILVDNAVAWYKDGLIISEKMEKTKTAYFAANDYIAEFISEYCERNNSAAVKRKDFLSRLKAEYPNETRGKSDQELTSAIIKIEGITYKRGTGGAYQFVGVALREGYQQDLGADFLPPDLK